MHGTTVKIIICSLLVQINRAAEPTYLINQHP